MTRIRSLAAVLAVLLTTEILWAQNALAPLRQKAALTDEDKSAIRAWVDQRIDEVIAAGGEKTKPSALNLLRDALKDSGKAFSEACAVACADKIASELRGAPLTVAPRLVTLLYGFSDSAAVRVLVEALQDQREAVRASGAIGLRRLAPAFAAQGAADVNAILTTLRDAGRSETSASVLKAIYQAMDYTKVPDAPDARANAAAVLELLETRAGTYEVGNPAPALGVDLAGVEILTGTGISLDDGQRRRLVASVAKMLRYNVWRYTTDPVLRRAKASDVARTRNRIERFIEEAETRLRGLGVGGATPPDIVGALRDGDPIAEMNKWAALLGNLTGEDYTLRIDAAAETEEAAEEHKEPEEP